MQSRRSLTAALAAFLVFALPACDFVGEEETLQIEKEVTFRFQFDTVDQVGEPITVQSTVAMDIDDILFGEGYTREDVALANIRSVEVDLIQPTSSNLDLFDSIELSLTAPGVNVPTHAASDDLPSDDSANLDVEAPGVTEVIREGEFRARLTVVPTVEETDVVIRAVVNMRIDLEGI